MKVLNLTGEALGILGINGALRFYLPQEEGLRCHTTWKSDAKLSEGMECPVRVEKFHIESLPEVKPNTIYIVPEEYFAILRLQGCKRDDIVTVGDRFGQLTLVPVYQNLVSLANF
jgi:hypothetical protein